MANLEKDLTFNPKIVELLKDDSFAQRLYASMCNMRWKKKVEREPEELVVDALMGKDPTIWSCSWRSAGGVVADIRNMHYELNECYMDYYCSGNEGKVDPQIKELLGEMGWTECPWPADTDG